MKWFLFLLFPALTTAQQSDLFLVDFTKTGNGYTITQPRFLSGFNPGGYTNQPAFVDDFRLLISAAPAQTPTSTDLYELNLQSNQLKQITKTKDREYSPQLSQDRKHLSCVIVDVEKGNKQILWLYPVDQSNGGKGLLKSMANVGYYCWLDSDWLAVFQVGDPNKLYLVNSKTGKSQFISSNTGRCLKRFPDGSLAYINKYSDEHWFIRKIKPNTMLSENIKRTLPGSEDFEILSDGSIIMATGSKIYHLDTSGDNLWKEIVDLQKWGINHISRMAYNGFNLLALVNEERGIED